MTEPIGEPTPEPVGIDEEAINELADDNQLLDMRAAKRLRTENQRLRHRLRESEANRQSSEEGRASDLARLAALEKREIEREASAVLADPSDLWLHIDEATQATFNDEFGGIVGDNVVEAAKRLVSERPHLAKRATPPPTNQPVEGLRPGASPEPAKPAAASWSTALRGH